MKIQRGSDQRRIKVLAEKKLEIERVTHIRDIFVFCCYTDLAYIDVKHLKRTELLKGTDDKLGFINLL